CARVPLYFHLMDYW
nr:immunoglobulin heavy chain junction region [Mus musculus]